MKKIFRLSSIKEVLTIVVNKLKKNKRKVVIGLSAFLVVFISVFSFINLRYPTKINAYIAHVINKGEPANKYFDDENFYKAVVDAYNKENKTSLSYITSLTDKQLKNIKSVSYSEKIKSATGIEKLTGLSYLQLFDSELYSINLSKNTLLTKLDLSYNNLSSIDLSKNISLTSLDLSYNNLSSVDLSNNVKLQHISLAENILSELDVSNLINLKTINLTNNNISSINLDNNVNIETIRLYNNDISEIEISKLSKLAVLDLSKNNLSQINLQNNSLLSFLSISHNKISTIDLSHLKKLEYLSAGINSMEEVDVSKNINLKYLYLYNDQNFCTSISCSAGSFNGVGGGSWAVTGDVLIKKIDLTNNVNLLELNAHNNNLQQIDLTHNQLLKKLNLGSNKLTDIDLSKNTKLREVDLGKGEINYRYGLGKGNRLTTIDLTNNKSLESLKLDSNYLTEINLSKNTKLREVDLSHNRLKTIILNNKLKENKLGEYINKQYIYQELISLGDDRIINPDLSIKYSINDKIIVDSIQNISDFIKKLNLKNLTAKIFDSDEEILSGNIKSGYVLKLYFDNTIIQSIPIYTLTNKYFDDYNFYKAVVDAYNKENNTSLSYDVNLTLDQLSTINKLSCDKEIKFGTRGIEKLTSLTYLNLLRNNISSIDLTKNTSLKELDLDNNKLSSIDLSKNTKLTYLSLSSNKLSSIDLSKNTSLTELYLDDNNLNSIDLSKNISLTSLGLDDNNLSSIDLSKNTKLTYLNLSSNKLSSIDLSKNTKLTYLSLLRNNISSIDLSKNTKLTYLNLSSNKLSSIDLSKNTFLERLYLDNNKLSSIDLSKNTKLTYLNLSSNKLSSIDLSKNTFLERLYLNDNNLSSIDLTKNTSLKELYLDNNKLSSIDLSQNTALTGLYLNDNNLNSIDLSKNISLTYLDLSSNNLNSIDLSKNISLTYLNLSSNKLSSIDLTKNTSLRYLYLKSNKISGIDLSKNTSLTELYLNDNELLYLNVVNYIPGCKAYYNDILVAECISIYNNPIPGNRYFKKDSLNENPYLFSSFFSTNYDIYDKSIINYNGDKFIANKIGQTEVSMEIKGISYRNATQYNGIGIWKVYDLTSEKYNINSEKKYIYTKNDTNSNTILSNINFDNVNGRIDNNKLILYDGNTIVDEYKIINLSSDIYDLSKDYIYDNNFNKDNINVVNGSLEEKDNTLNIKYNDEILDSKKIVKVTSNTYDLSKDYIYDNNFNKDNINVVNGSLEEKDNTLNIKYNDEILDSKKIVKITSDKYDLTKDYIYNVNNPFDVSDIKCINCKAVYENSKLTIKYNDDVLKEIDVVSINFESSEYDLSKDYIYIGTGSFDESKMKTENITYEIESNILKLKYKDELLKSYKLVSVSSDVYQIKDKYLYVFDSMFDKSNIKVTNGTFDVANNKVTIKYSEDKLDEFDIVGISSSVYDLRNGYILLKTNEKLDLSLINTANVTLDLNGDTLNVLFNSEVIRTYKIVRYESSKYDLTKDYIYLGIKEFNKDDIVLENCTVEEKDNVLDIKYGDEIVRSYKLVRVSSNDYKVGNGYIYTKNEEFNSNLLDVTNASIEEQENSINIIYGKDKLDEFKLLKVTSDKYDLTKDYIYIGNKELDKSKFNLTNCTLQVDNSTLNIKYDNDVLKSYKLVKIYSNTYDLNKNYIYVGNGIFDKNLLSVVNGTVNVLNDKIEIKYNNDVLKEFKLLKYSSNKYDLTKEYIYLGINNFDKNNISLVNLSLNVDDNYNLNIKNGDDVMKTYKLVSVSSSKYDLSKDNIRVTKSDGLDFKDIKVTNGTKEYLNDKLYIKYNDDILKVYTISTRAKGDITGDDKITIADVSLLYRNVRKTKVITDSETLEISDLTGDGKITIADVAKLYRYVRGKITEL